MKIPRKIYYEKTTGNILQDCGERQGSVIETTVDQDFQSYVSLSERVKDTVGVIQLSYGEYADKFGVYYYNIVDGAIVWGDLIDVSHPPVIPQPTNQEIADNQITLMDVLATIYEGMYAKGTV